MGRRKPPERIACRYYRWNLVVRKGIYYADGRSNKPGLGLRSLGTKNRDEALNRLQLLDHKIAVENGRATTEDSPTTKSDQTLPLNLGRKRYEDHVQRPRIAGGVSKTSQKRYQAVLDKFVAFAKPRGIDYWSQVDRRLLEIYAAWLDKENYAYRTAYLELMTIKQVVKWMVRERLLPADRIIVMPLKKAIGTDRYCWTHAEVRAMQEHCLQQPDLVWLGRVIIALACTGLRISELASLRWSDIDFENEKISLTDESKSAHIKKRTKRTTKTGRSRSFPIHPDLRKVLNESTNNRSGCVFHGPKGGRLKPDTVRLILIRDVLAPLEGQFPTSDDEIGFIDGRLHSFRHYFCSMCANRNVSEQLLMAWLGHRQSAMVKHYYHVDHKEAIRQMSGLDLV